MKKICLVLPNLKAGGQERVMSYLANYFVEKSEIEINLILLTKAEKAYYISPKVIIHEPLSYFNTKYRIFSTLKTMLFIRKSICGIKPSTVLSFGELWNSLVLLSLLFVDVNIYISDRCRPTLKINFIQRFLRFILYPKATGIISQTNLARKIMYKRIKHKNIIVIGNPIPQFEPKNNFKQNIILNVGRFITEKRQKLLIKMFSELNRDDWQLVFVGSGTLLLDCKKYAIELGVDKNVIFAGEIRNIDEYYLKSKVFAFTSTSEGFPNVLGEALSAGLATVSFKFEAGDEDLIKDNINGFLVPDNDTVLFKRRLLELMDNKEIRDKFSQNSKHVLKDFNPSFVCEKYFKFITN